MRSLLAAMCALAAGCSQPGPCEDRDGAFELVYQQDGLPAFAGQAIVIQSCGGGAFCHSDGVDPRARFGAPAGLGFDLTLASTTGEVAEEDTLRLMHHQENLLNNADSVWYMVDTGEMPPRGEAGAEYEAQITEFYQRLSGDTASPTFTDLPRLNGDSPEERSEAQAIFRNWLACGAPLVERTAARIDLQPPTAGWCVRGCDRTCVEPSFESIYRQILLPSCALSACHDSDDPEGFLDLLTPLPLGVPLLPTFDPDGPDQTEAVTPEVLAQIRDRLVNAPSMSSGCEEEIPEPVLLVPGDADASLLFRKVAAVSAGAEVCGDPMPFIGNPLSDQRLCAIREWINCGACLPGEPGCDACIAAARTTCEVAGPFDQEAGSAPCANPEPCFNRQVPENACLIPALGP